MIHGNQALGERALFRSLTAWGVEAITDDVTDLERGFHAVVMTFEGKLTAVRFANVVHHPEEPWRGALATVGQGRAPHVAQGEPDAVVAPERRWDTSLTREAYEASVERVREHIKDGTAYQVNVCRVMSHEAAGGRARTDMDGLFGDILTQNPAPYACRIDVSGALDIVSASPELFLGLQDGQLTSGPIKGTAVSADQMLAKDMSENIMITDLVRNDLQRVCLAGSVVVDPLLETQHHPGLVHLVSTVQGQLRPHTTWQQVMEACFPPGSVSGAPKSSALRIIEELEPVARGPYCGAIGWIDADSGQAELAVGIRTFWQEPGRNETGSGSIESQTLAFGTGAGITWHSEPAGEWEETQLKARRLVALAERHMARER